MVPQVHVLLDCIVVLPPPTYQLVLASYRDVVITVNHQALGCALNHELEVFLVLRGVYACVESLVTLSLDDFLLEQKELLSGLEVSIKLEGAKQLKAINLKLRDVFVDEFNEFNIVLNLGFRDQLELSWISELLNDESLDQELITVEDHLVPKLRILWQ